MDTKTPQLKSVILRIVFGNSRDCFATRSQNAFDALLGFRVPIRVLFYGSVNSEDRFGHGSYSTMASQLTPSIR